MLNPVVTGILVFLISVGVGTTLYRMIVGPSILDRILGSDVLLSAFAAILCVLMLIQVNTDQLILLLVICVTGFIGSVTVARFVYGQRARLDSPDRRNPKNRDAAHPDQRPAAGPDAGMAPGPGEGKAINNDGAPVVAQAPTSVPGTVSGVSAVSGALAGLTSARLPGEPKERKGERGGTGRDGTGRDGRLSRRRRNTKIPSEHEALEKGEG